jgi:hypothetical protein
MLMVVALGPGGVLRREFDVGDKGPGALDAFHSETKNFALRFTELEFAMELGSAEENVNPPLFSRRLDGLAGGFDVLGHTTGQSADGWAFDFAGDFLDRGEVAVARHGETGLDDIDAEPGELTGHFEFFAWGHGGAGALFAIAERRIEYDDAVVFHGCFRWWRRVPDSDIGKQKTPPPGLAVGLMVQIAIKTRLPPCTAAGRW